MGQFLRSFLAMVFVTTFSCDSFAGFPKEAWLAPDRCTQLVTLSECPATGDYACGTGYESTEKRMEFFVDDLDYLEAQWGEYGEGLQRLGRAEGVLRYRGQEMYDAYLNDFATDPNPVEAFKTAFAADWLGGEDPYSM